MRVDRVLLPLSRGRFSISVGQQVGMLETVGAKSGEPRSIPLLFIRDGDRVVLIASMGGAPRHPAWLHNIRANPRVRFLGPRGTTGDYLAREAEGDERDRLWDEAVDYYAGYATYKVRAGTREIPIVVLERA
jgi:deazaflavin-dependent oxidoreductase (nitroreductase family)